MRSERLLQRALELRDGPLEARPCLLGVACGLFELVVGSGALERRTLEASRLVVRGEPAHPSAEM
jgi:hypothetical protein